MFDSLSKSLQKTLKHLRGYGKLSEKNVTDALREVRLSLLEADVNFQVVKDFIGRVRERCLGQDVLDSVTPGQQMTKRIYDELVVTLGGEHKDIDVDEPPAGVMLLGLHGSGKTTTAGKLALRWEKEGKKVLLAACDIRRPAAVDQLRVLADQAGVEMIAPEPGDRVPDVGQRARDAGKAAGAHIIIYDTGGRFQIEDMLVKELQELRSRVEPRNAILVLDAAIGQESVNVAERFHEAIGLTGVILTKLDGDARGGAALSVQAVTGCPILLTGVGERPEDLEPFYPDRMASRILGMGDVVSLVEKAQQVVDEKEMARVEEHIRKNTLDLEDFLAQLNQMKKLGPMQNLFDLLPTGGNIPDSVKDKIADRSARESDRAIAIIQSMTPGERRDPSIINAGRRRRIARGSGSQVQDVNELLKNFGRMRKMTRHLKKAQKRLLRTGN